MSSGVGHERFMLFRVAGRLEPAKEAVITRDADTVPHVGFRPGGLSFRGRRSRGVPVWARQYRPSRGGSV